MLVFVTSSPGSFWESSLLGALVGAMAAICGGMLQSWLAGRREQRKDEQVANDAKMAQARDVIEYLVSLQSFLECKDAEEDWQTGADLAPALKTRLVVEIGVLKDAECRSALELGLKAIPNMYHARNYGEISFSPLSAQRQIAEDMTAFATAAARGEQPSSNHSSRLRALTGAASAAVKLHYDLMDEAKEVQD